LLLGSGQNDRSDYEPETSRVGGRPVMMATDESCDFLLLIGRPCQGLARPPEEKIRSRGLSGIRWHARKHAE
jgi:hypothetical protein